MSLRLRQLCLSVLCRAEKPGGPPTPRRPPPLYGCHGEQVSPAALCHTHVGTFSLSSSLSFLPLTFYRAASPRGLPKGSFLSADNAWCVMDIPIHIQCKEEQALKIQGLFSSQNTWQQIHFLSVVGFEWVDCVLYPTTCQVRW